VATMTLQALGEKLATIPRKSIGFFPTPFHRVDNISKKYGVDIYFKREDLAGPSWLTGSKIRKAEFIIAEALAQGITHIITMGAYISNSSGQIATAAIQAGITPIVYLYDTVGEGHPAAWRGNLLLTQLMGVEVHFLPQDGRLNSAAVMNNVETRLAAKKAALEAQGHKVMVVPIGALHNAALPAHLGTFKEIIDQSAAQGFTPDYIYHSTGTGGVLPALVAGKMLTDIKTAIRSISINFYTLDNFINTPIIVARVKAIFERLGIIPPEDAAIMAQLDIDQRFVGEDYAIPSAAGVAAIKELAQLDGIFLGPVYTAKGFAGLLGHIREGKLPQGSQAVFVHTGDVNNLFEIAPITGTLFD